MAQFVIADTNVDDVIGLTGDVIHEGKHKVAVDPLTITVSECAVRVTMEGAMHEYGGCV